MENINQINSQVPETKVVFPSTMEIIKCAWKIFKDNWGRFILNYIKITFVFILAHATVLVLFYFYNNKPGIEIGILSDIIYNVYYVIIALSTSVISYSIMYRRELNYIDIIKNRYQQLIILSVLSYLCIEGGGWLLFIPALIFYLASVLDLLLFIDNDKISGYESLRKSFYLTKNYRVDILTFHIGFVFLSGFIMIPIIIPLIFLFSDLYPKIYSDNVSVYQGFDGIINYFSVYKDNFIGLLNDKYGVGKMVSLIILSLSGIIIILITDIVFYISSVRIFDFLKNNNKFIPDQKYHNFTRNFIYLLFIVGLVAVSWSFWDKHQTYQEKMKDEADKTSLYKFRMGDKSNLFPMYGAFDYQDYINNRSESRKKADDDFISLIIKQDGSKKEAYKDTIKAAWMLISRKDYNTAMKRCNQAWLLDQNNFNNDWCFGAALGGINKLEESNIYFEKAITNYKKVDEVTEGNSLLPLKRDTLRNYSILVVRYSEEGASPDLNKFNNYLRGAIKVSKSLADYIQKYQIDNNVTPKEALEDYYFYAAIIEYYNKDYDQSLDYLGRLTYLDEKISEDPNVIELYQKMKKKGARIPKY